MIAVAGLWASLVISAEECAQPATSITLFRAGEASLAAKPHQHTSLTDRCHSHHGSDSHGSAASRSSRLDVSQNAPRTIAA